MCRKAQGVILGFPSSQLDTFPHPCSTVNNSDQDTVSLHLVYKAHGVR